MYEGPPLEIKLGRPGEFSLHMCREIAAIYAGETGAPTDIVITGLGDVELRYSWVDAEARAKFLELFNKHGSKNIEILDPHRTHIAPPEADPDPSDLCFPV